jgi:phenylpyruvate tautomerase PptA (4-oxalocrotonate tautomerase family)
MTMPYARISLLKGKPAPHIRAVADSLHRALVDAFGVPLKDRFQIIQSLAPEEFIFDRDYLFGPRSDDFVLVHITAGRPRDAATREAFYQRAVAYLGEAPGLRPEDVMIVISTTQTDEWSFGCGVAGVLGGRPAPAS